MIRTLKAFTLHTPSFAVGITFMTVSVLFGSWIARLPEVKHALALSEAQLGFSLLGMAVGSLIATFIASFLFKHISTGKATSLGAFLTCLAFILPIWADNAIQLFLVLLAIGLADGFLNIAMNTAAASIQHHHHITIMSTCHGFFSLGGMIGAGSSGLIASVGVPLSIHLVVIATLLFALHLYLRPILHNIPDMPRQEGPAFALPSKSIAGFVWIGFCIMLGEGAIADWSAIYLTDIIGSTPLMAGLGFAAFSFSMAIGRFLGDAVTRRYGPQRIVFGGSILGAAGMLLVLLVPVSIVVVMGFFLIGVGFSSIVPILFSAASKDPSVDASVGIAAVATGGLLGFLLGPPLIGFIAEGVGLSFGLTLILLLSLAAALAARNLKW
jgi:predicted MFS family arabinose efflux permease